LRRNIQSPHHLCRLNSDFIKASIPLVTHGIHKDLNW
jgi:hypothetical protein